MIRLVQFEVRRAPRTQTSDGEEALGLGGGGSEVACHKNCGFRRRTDFPRGDEPVLPGHLAMLQGWCSDARSPGCPFVRGPLFQAHLSSSLSGADLSTVVGRDTCFAPGPLTRGSRFSIESRSACRGCMRPATTTACTRKTADSLRLLEALLREPNPSLMVCRGNSGQGYEFWDGPVMRRGRSHDRS